MAIFSSFAIKFGVGIASTLALIAGACYGVPKLFKNFLNKFLNDVELEILSDDQDWTVNPESTEDSESQKIAVKVSKTTTKKDSSDVIYSWECVITATGDDAKNNSDKLVNSLKEMLNTNREDKRVNRVKLVLACSGKRETTNDPNSVKANLDLDLSKHTKLLDLDEALSTRLQSIN